MAILLALVAGGLLIVIGLGLINISGHFINGSSMGDRPSSCIGWFFITIGVLFITAVVTGVVK